MQRLAKQTLMAKRKVKEQPKGLCKDCDNAYDWHERTNYPPHEFFMCWCKHERWAQFLNKPCINGKFKHKTNQ